jgi:hypothetical protein
MISRIANLHTTKLEMDAMLVGLHYMINIIHTTPHYYLMPTLLATESYINTISGENWKSAAIVYSLIFFTI